MDKKLLEWFSNLPPPQQNAFMSHIASKVKKKVTWPTEYTNSKTGRVYQPHNEQEADFVYSDSPAYYAFFGGEGAGKSAAGIIKTLGRLKRGMSGIAVAPDFQHFKRLWPEFRDWIPWQFVLKRMQYLGEVGRIPTQGFTLTFINELRDYSTLLCGGAEEHSLHNWRGPNVCFVWGDEFREHKTPAALKLFSGRIRKEGPNGEPPQLYYTTTPKKNYLFDYFGPLQDDDPLADFKANSKVARVTVEENKDNLAPGYIERRRTTLTASEARVFMDAEWEDESDVEKFVNIMWWQHCQEILPPLRRDEPIVIALDAAKGSEVSIADCFAVVAVSRHPHRKEDVAVRYCGIWQPQKGQLLDFEPIEKEVVRLCQEFSVIEVAYDPYQLHDMAMRLKKAGIGNFKEFQQGKPRLLADKQLQDLIMARRIAHDGNPLLTKHIDNANIKKAGADGIRLIKRTGSLKIDGAVGLSMGANRILYFNITS